MVRRERQSISQLFIKKEKLRSTILRATRRRMDFLLNLLRLIEHGGVIFKHPLELQEAVITYLFAKWLFWYFDGKTNPSATYEELDRIRAHPGRGNLNEILRRLSSPEESIILPTETGYMLNPEKIEDGLKIVEDYVATRLGR
jgi:hypothetical protein